MSYTGYIYIAANEVDINLLKIGMTTQDPYERIKSLNTTGVAHPLKLIKYYQVTNPHDAEKLIHRHLASWRYRSDREFFSIGFDYADKAIVNLLNKSSHLLPYYETPNSTPSNRYTGYHVDSDNRLTVFIVCLLFGLLGAHHFLFGKVSTGLIYLFSFGLFGFGWLFDLIKIALGASSLITKVTTQARYNYSGNYNSSVSSINSSHNSAVHTGAITLIEEHNIDPPDEESDATEYDSEIVLNENADYSYFSENGEDISDLRNIEMQNAEIPTCRLKPYILPPIDLLDKYDEIESSGDTSNDKLKNILASYGIDVDVVNCYEGYSVTLYEIKPDVGVSRDSIAAILIDISMHLKAYHVEIATISSKSILGICVYRSKEAYVPLRHMLESEFYLKDKSAFVIPVGTGIDGQQIFLDFLLMPHLLIYGNSTIDITRFTHTILISLFINYPPHKVKFMIFDSNEYEYQIYTYSPHLLTVNITDPLSADRALMWVIREIERRNSIFQQINVRNIASYNAFQMSSDDDTFEDLPAFYIIINDAVDIIRPIKNSAITSLEYIASHGRAVGIILIMATNHVQSSCISDSLKANLLSRICFKVNTKAESMSAINTGGAEKLYLNSDILFLQCGFSQPIRGQAAFCSEKEIESVMRFVKNQSSEFSDNKEENYVDTDREKMMEIATQDVLFDRSVQIVIETGYASVSLLKIKLNIEYTHAARLIDAMQYHGLIGPFEGSKPRKVIITKEQYNANKADDHMD